MAVVVCVGVVVGAEVAVDTGFGVPVNIRSKFDLIQSGQLNITMKAVRFGASEEFLTLTKGISNRPCQQWNDLI